MASPLRIVWPIQNAERTLAKNVRHLLDILPDLSEQFEILLLEKGSTDQTEEVAHELSVQYPQLRFANRTRWEPVFDDKQTLMVPDDCEEVDDRAIANLRSQRVANTGSAAPPFPNFVFSASQAGVIEQGFVS